MSSALILASREGDEVAFSELSKIYAPLIESMTERYFRSKNGYVSDKDDLRQEATVAFYRAVMTYDLSQNEVSFGLYAKVCIRNRLVSLLRRLKRDALQKKTEYRNTHTSRLDSLSYDREGMELVANRLLSKKEKIIFSLYADGKSYKEISSQLKITEKSVDNALFRAKTKLRGHFK